MLRGFFGDLTGRPYIDARISIPELGIVDEIPFLIDSGADRTYLSAADAAYIGIDVSKLTNPISVAGVGGSSRAFQQRALLAFTDGRTVSVFAVEMGIASPSEPPRDAPSLLGRDILARWTLLLDQPRGRIWAKVKGADVTLPHGGAFGLIAPVRQRR